MYIYTCIYLSLSIYTHTKHSCLNTVRYILYRWFVTVVKWSCLINNSVNKLLSVCKIIISIFVSLKRQLQEIVNILDDAVFLDCF